MATIRRANVTWEPVGGNFRATSNITFAAGAPQCALCPRRGRPGLDDRRRVAGAQWTPIDGQVLERGSHIATPTGSGGVGAGAIYVIGSASVYTNRTHALGFVGPYVGYTELPGAVPGGDPVAFAPAVNEATGTNPVPDQTLLFRDTDSRLLKTTQAGPGLPYSPYEFGVIGGLLDG